MHLTRIGKTLCAGLLAVSMMLPGMSVCATETSTTVPEMTSGTNLIKKVIKSTNEYVTYTDEEFSFTFVQEGEGTEDGETTNATKVDLGTVTLTATQDLKASDTNVKTAATRTKDKKGRDVITTDAYWTKTVYGNVDLDVFTVPGIYTYIVTEDTHTGNNSLATWTNSGAKYRLRVYVENIGSDELAKTATIQQLKYQDGTDVGTSTVKVDLLEFDNSVTAPNLSLTKYFTGEETNSGQAYTFKVSKKSGDVPGSLQYILIDANGDSVLNSDGTKIHTVALDTNFNVKANQTVIFINIPEGASVNVDETSYTLSKLSTIRIVEEYVNYIYDEEGKASGKHKKSDIPVEAQGTQLTYYNNYEQEMIVTGVVTDIAPYITLVVIAVAGIAAYIIIRKRMR